MANPDIHINTVNLHTIDTTGPYPNYDILDTEAKRLLRSAITNILTPEIRRECDGLTILVLSRDERDIMMLALKEKAERKRQQRLITC